MIEIYTDGACSQIANTGRGPGGWAAMVILPGQPPVEIAGGAKYTTNNRMEMQAVIEGLRYIGGSQSITLYTDSAYICNCINNGWYKKWQKNGWLTTAKKAVENQELWQAMLALLDQHKVKMMKVKGHSTNANNNRCDQLAVAEVSKYRN